MYVSVNLDVRDNLTAMMNDRDPYHKLLIVVRSEKSLLDLLKTYAYASICQCIVMRIAPKAVQC